MLYTKSEGSFLWQQEVKKMKNWVDDIRSVPLGYIGVKSVNQAIAMIEMAVMRSSFLTGSRKEGHFIR